LETTVDLAAVNRVAKRVELKGVRLAGITASCDPNALGPSLKPDVNLDCKLGDHNDTNLEVVCNYTFLAQSGEVKAIESEIRYLLLYEITGSESPSPSDLAEFARANGALHSWPFVRELLYGLTSRMGFPPYTLPVMHFKTVNSPPTPQQGAATAGQEKTTKQQSSDVEATNLKRMEGD
jgi:preprotein translocase subunit SecB